MPIVAYAHLSDHMAGAEPDAWPAVVLIFGEELLCKKACNRVLHALATPEPQGLDVEIVDGAEMRIHAALSSVNTYALWSTKKVVVYRDARLFHATGARQALREKMEAAGRQGAWKKASRHLLDLLSVMGLTLEDVHHSNVRSKVTADAAGTPATWFSALMDYCRENGLTVPVATDDADLLQAAMQKGFPQGQHLILTADVADRRKALFKAIAKQGLVVDCSVAKGETKADRQTRDAVSQAIIDDLLAKSGKRMAAAGRRQLVAWTGFDLRTLSSNLEKLISYVGERGTITEADVSTALRRTRKDPIFELTNAVASRDRNAALFYLQSLLAEGLHPLQLLAALANQLRRLLIAKDFIDRDGGRTWAGHLSFPQFKTGSFKAVLADDAELASRLTADSHERVGLQKNQGAKKLAGTDLMLARNPKSPYPVFQTLKNADRFSLQELAGALIDLSEIDLAMKSGGQDPVRLLEVFLLRFLKTAA